MVTCILLVTRLAAWLVSGTKHIFSCCTFFFFATAALTLIYDIVCVMNSCDALFWDGALMHTMFFNVEVLASSLEDLEFNTLWHAFF